jgi:flagellin-like hook-associated protein FlgL
MRITFTTVNRNVQRNLSRRYSDMVNLQEQLSTGKRLRKPSDNPVDVANTIKLRAKETQLGQYKRNIEDGLAVMGVAASAMASMNELLHRARELAVQAANGTYNDSDRLYMQQEVDQLYRQMMSVVNTQFKGTYIFNGTNGNVPPYKIASSGSGQEDYINRTMATFGTVFARKADGVDWNTPNVPDPDLVTAGVHDLAGDTLYLNYATNNLRVGDKVQLTWHSGAAPIDLDVEGRKLQYVYPETFPLDTIDIPTGARPYAEKGLDYEIDYVTGQISVLSEDFRDALNNIAPANRPALTSISGAVYNPVPPDPKAPNGLTYRTNNVFQIVEGKLGDDIHDIFPGSMKIKIGNKEYLEGHGEYQPDYYDADGVLQKGKNQYDYEVDYETGKITVYNTDLLRDMRPEWLGGPATTASFSSTLSGITTAASDVQLYRYPNTPVRDIAPGTVTVTAGGAPLNPSAYYINEIDGTFTLLDSAYDGMQFEIKYSLSTPDATNNMYRANQLQMTFDYVTRGVDIYGDRVTSNGDILRAIEEGIVTNINIGADDLLKDARSGNEMVGVLLRYSQALLKDDRDGIQRALDELTTMYDAVLNSQSDMGARIYRFELTAQRNGEQTIEVGAQVSALADADLAEVISRLLLAENVYNAALQAAMRVLQPSLANYM